LIFVARGVKPAVTMKALSRRFRFVVLGVIVMVVVVSCVCVFPTVKDSRITLYEVAIGGPPRNPPYVEWTTQQNFDNALDKVCWSRGHGHAWYEFYTDTNRTHLYKPCPAPPATGKIRTVKVTKSKAADKIAGVEPAANDANALWRVRSADPGDIKTVLDALKP
jgi:hypothetical protein